MNTWTFGASGLEWIGNAAVKKLVAWIPNGVAWHRGVLINGLMQMAGGGRDHRLGAKEKRLVPSSLTRPAVRLWRRLPLFPFYQSCHHRFFHSDRYLLIRDFVTGRRNGPLRSWVEGYMERRQGQMYRVQWTYGVKEVKQTQQTQQALWTQQTQNDGERVGK